MMFRFKSEEATIGMRLTCVKSTSTYFKEGKVYPVVKHERLGIPVVMDEAGCGIRNTSSYFIPTYLLQQRPVKLHQVWQAKDGGHLVRIYKVEGTSVYYEYFDELVFGVPLRGVRNLKTFTKTFIFIF